MPYSERNGVKTYYEATGEGMPFVMLHANPCDHWMWSYQIANFSHRFRVIAPDMRGYGRTDKPLEIYSFDALVEDVLGVLEQEGVENGILATMIMLAPARMPFATPPCHSTPTTSPPRASNSSIPRSAPLRPEPPLSTALTRNSRTALSLR